MDESMTLGDVDRDGVLADGAHEAAGHTRAELLRRAIFGAGALGAGGALLGGLSAEALAAPRSARRDVQILSFAIVLEYLGASFYDEAIRRRRLRGEDLRFARVVRAHERDHVAFVAAAIRRLGGRPPRAPRFEFGRTTVDLARFRRTSQALETLCVEALDGAGPLVTKPTLAAAGALVSVEARHAAWMADIRSRAPVPDAFHPARTLAQTRRAVARTNFVVSA